MLPFLRKDRNIGSTVEIRKPDAENDQENHGLKSVAEDIIRAIETKDVKLLMTAIKAAFELCDSEPHEEGPDTTEE